MRACVQLQRMLLSKRSICNECNGLCLVKNENSTPELGSHIEYPLYECTTKGSIGDGAGVVFGADGECWYGWGS